MSPRINEEPGLPAWRYPQHVEAVLSQPYTRERAEAYSGRPLHLQRWPTDEVADEVEKSLNRSPHILGQNPTGTSYGRQFRSLEYRRRVGLGVGRDPRQGLLRVALCALLVAALCAWMFWNANFARP